MRMTAPPFGHVRRLSKSSQRQYRYKLHRRKGMGLYFPFDLTDKIKTKIKSRYVHIC